MRGGGGEFPLPQVPCNPVLPAPWSDSQRLNYLPHLVCQVRRGLWTPGRTKNTTCQRADELLASQRPPTLQNQYPVSGFLTLIPLALRAISNSLFNPSSELAATAFCGREFHRFTTVWVKKNSTA